MSHQAPRSWRDVTLADMGGTLNDPSSFMSGAAVQNSDGSIGIPLLGSKALSLWASTPHPKLAVYGVAPLYDAFGRQVTGDVCFSTTFRILFPGGVPSKNDNVMVGIGIINESSPAGGTVDGLPCAFDADATVNSYRVRVWTLKDGTIANHVAGTAGASGAGGGLEVSFARMAKTGIFVQQVKLITATGTLVSGSAATPAAFPNQDNTGPKYIVVYAGRTSAADTDQYTVAPRVQYLPPVVGVA